jgi:hypothetical protein
MKSRRIRNYSSEGRCAELKQIVVGKKHMRSSGSTGLLDHVSKSVGKFTQSDSDTDVVEKQMPANSITRRPLPGNTGLIDRDLEFHYRDQNKRGVSMPTFPSSSAKGGEDKEHNRRSSFSKLLRLAISQVTQFELTELTAKTQFSQSVLEAAGRQSSQFRDL